MSYSPQNVSNMPPPISMTDQAFIEKLSEGVGRIQLARFIDDEIEDALKYEFCKLILILLKKLQDWLRGTSLTAMGYVRLEISIGSRDQKKHF